MSELPAHLRRRLSMAYCRFLMAVELEKRGHRHAAAAARRQAAAEAWRARLDHGVPAGQPAGDRWLSVSREGMRKLALGMRRPDRKALAVREFRAAQIATVVSSIPRPVNHGGNRLGIFCDC